MQQNQIEQAKQFIKEADAVLITAGAGMGVDSGLPDFRGNKGFWKEYPVIASLNLNFEEMANPKWFEENPSLAWAFYGHRLNLYRDTVPHEGFQMLLNLVKTKNNDYFVYTSNVDGQFQKAGFSSEKIVEVHGSIHYFQCSKNCKKEIWKADNQRIEIDMDKFKALTIPQCKFCEAVARPNILMFGDWSWNGSKSKKQEDRFHNWMQTIKKSKKSLAIIEIGAGTTIPTIRNSGEKFAKNKRNMKLIRINPRDFYISKYVGWSIPYGAVEGLKKLLSSKTNKF